MKGTLLMKSVIPTLYDANSTVYLRIGSSISYRNNRNTSKNYGPLFVSAARAI